MVEIVVMGERMEAMNDTEAKTTKITILDKQVVVAAAETTMGHKEGAAAVNANATEGVPQAGHGKHNGGRARAGRVQNPSKLWAVSVCSTGGH